jgi:hypothetical protein
MREGLCREKERLIGERISLSRVVDNCNRSLADPATVFETGSVRRDAAKLHSATRNADAFWGRKCHRTKMRRSRVVAVSFAPAIDALVRAGQHRRSEGTHRLLAARLAGSQRPKPECCPCQSAPNHHTKSCYHSGHGPDGNVVCRSVPRVARLYLIGANLFTNSFQLPEKITSSAADVTNAVFESCFFQDLNFFNNLTWRSFQQC